MTSRGVGAALIALVLATVVGSSTPAANAATGPACQASASMPTRVAVDNFSVMYAGAVLTTCSNYTIDVFLDGPRGAHLGPGTGPALVFSDTASHFSDSFFSYQNVVAAYTTRLGWTMLYSNSGVTWTKTTISFKYATYSYVASSRIGRAVYINGLIKNWSNSYLGMQHGGGRTVYLQRLLHGTWQTMLARTTDADGRIAVGFIQSTAFAYRLVTAETATAWSGISATTSVKPISGELGSAGAARGRRE